jgi:membrane protein
MLPNLVPRVERYLFDHRAEARTVSPLRYLYALIHDLFRGDLTMRAMSLVYTTLLSVVPLLALSFSILKGLGYHRDFEPLLYQFLEPLGEKAFTLTSQTMEFVENIQGGVLGSIGLIFLLWTSLSMVQKIEESFNYVWRVKEPRGFARRISEYISVLLVGPTLIIASLGILASMRDYEVVQAIAGIAPFGAILLGLSKATPYILVAGVFTFLYGFIPNTKVRLRAALIGGLIAGLLWAASGVLFAKFFSLSKGTLLIYAGFAVAIMALFWLYLSWLILLLGAQIAFYVQHPYSLRPGAGTLHLTPQLSERLGFSTMYLLGLEYIKGLDEQRKSYTLNSLADRLFLPSAVLEPIVSRLMQSNLIVIAEDDSLLPGRDLATIKLTDILCSIRISVDSAAAQLRSVPAADGLSKHAEEALHASLGAKSLRDWLEEDLNRAQLKGNVTA